MQLLVPINGDKMGGLALLMLWAITHNRGSSRNSHREAT